LELPFSLLSLFLNLKEFIVCPFDFVLQKGIPLNDLVKEVVIRST